MPVVTARALLSADCKNIADLERHLVGQTDPILCSINSRAVPGIYNYGQIVSTQNFQGLDALTFSKRYEIILGELFDQISSQLNGLTSVDGIFVSFGTAEIRTSWDLNLNRFALSQAELFQMINENLNRIGVKSITSENIVIVDNTCASSLLSLGLCSEKINHMIWQSAFVLAIDLVTDLVLEGLAIIRALADPKIMAGNKNSRPFSKSRSGFVRTEASCLVLVESQDAATNRNAEFTLKIEGYGQSHDTVHLTAGDSEATGIKKCISEALANSKTQVSEITHIKSHGTGTIINDKNESRALRETFIDQSPLVLSFKGQFGHAASASGLFEFIILEHMIKMNRLFPALNCEDLDEELSLSLVRNIQGAHGIQKIVMNAFGFGALNCSLVLSQKLTLS